MRKKIDQTLLGDFMTAFARGVRSPTRIYLVGGASAVLLGWRDSTIDINLKLISETDVLRTIPEIKERLQVNVELASPDDFIPQLPDWESRSSFIKRIGQVDYFHYDFYAQALAKIERGHDLDKTDVREMIDRGLIEKKKLVSLFLEIEPNLYKYPAIDPPAFRQSVETVANE
ncbi:MAG TPA: DUF6036 family nucleotidyltransferase [Pyrinomonadaceae bacterium]